MTDRGNREEEARRMASQRADERRRNVSNESAPPADAGTRRVGEARSEREGHSERRGGGSQDSGLRSYDESSRNDRDADRSADRNADDRGTSWASVIFGWLAALGASLILSSIVGGIVAAILGALGVGGGTEGGTAALVGLLVTLFLAFLIGGYVAGRLASRSGLKHGLLVPLLALLVTILLGLIATITGFSLIDNLSGVTLPQGLQGAGQDATQQAPQNLGTILTVSGLLALLVPFVGGALGGIWGAKTGRNRP